MGDEVTQPDQVICYSGYTYAQRPVAVIYGGQRLEVSQIETEWASPKGAGFKISTRDGRRFKCDYYELGDSWQVTPA